MWEHGLTISSTKKASVRLYPVVEPRAAGGDASQPSQPGVKLQEPGARIGSPGFSPVAMSGKFDGAFAVFEP